MGVPLVSSQKRSFTRVGSSLELAEPPLFREPAVLGEPDVLGEPAVLGEPPEDSPARAPCPAAPNRAPALPPAMGAALPPAPAPALPGFMPAEPLCAPPRASAAEPAEAASGLELWELHPAVNS